MENLEKLFDVMKHCESNGINTNLDAGYFGYILAIYLHKDMLDHTTAILSILKVLDIKCDIGIKDKHFEDGHKIRVITIKTERA